jgi:hypothetical protein
MKVSQLAGLRAMTIHAAPSIITDRSPGRPAKTARTSAAARRGSSWHAIRQADGD